VPEVSEDLATLAAKSDTSFILAMFVDLRGKPCAKLVPVEAVEDFQLNGVGFAGYAAGALGQEPSDPDIVAMPDSASFTPVPFVRDGLAIVHCDPHVEGKPWPYAPRVILRQMLDRAAQEDMSVVVGAEVEYFLVNRDDRGRLSTADAGDVAAKPCYDARGVTRMYDHLTEVSRGINDLGWGNYANDHEDANGQFEQNFQHSDALTTADRVVTMRYLLTMIAEKRGMTATFMPKPFKDRTGTGLHLHLSLWAGEHSLMPAEGEDRRGLGLSDRAYWFIGGVLEHAGALQAVLAPTVNSYKRTGGLATTSGASWAPRVPTFGGNDRTHYVRVPDRHRIELRGGDGAANPYLAIAATVGAGLDGISKQADPGSPGGDNGRERRALPMTLLDAVESLEADAVVRAALDVAGPGVAEYFAECKRAEFFDWHSQVTAWEIDNYVTAF